MPDGTLEYAAKLNTFLNTGDIAKPLKGTKVGVLEESFHIVCMDQNIATLCRSAVDKLEDLGAEVISISIPGHLKAAILGGINVPIGGTRQGLFTDLTGRKQLYMIDRLLASHNPMKQKAFDALGPGAQNAYIRYLYMIDKYGPLIHAKSSNLLRNVNVSLTEFSFHQRPQLTTRQDGYDRALASVDVLVMPTLPSPPCRLFDDPTLKGPLERLSRNIGLGGNVSPFNSTYCFIPSQLTCADTKQVPAIQR